jgi:hypothetical protein
MLTLALLVLTAAPAQLRVAVPNFNAINVAPESAAFFMDRFANRLRARGLAVTSATEIETVLGLERQKTLLGCAEDSTTCQAEIAAALGADAIVRARVARFGARFELTLTLVDPANATVVGSVSASAADEGQVLDVLDAGADELAQKLLAAKRTKGASVPDLKTIAPSTSRPSWVPLIPLAVGVGAGIGGAIALSESYRKAALIKSVDDFETVGAEAKIDRGVGIALLGVGAAGLATAAILFFTGKEPAATPVAVLSRDSAWVGIEGRFP